MNASTLRVLCAAALLMLMLMAKGCLLSLPAEQPAGPGEFDTARAMQRLERILAGEQPHPADSAANDVVRERLMAELRAVGLDPQVTDDFTCNGFGGAPVVSCARVRNVLATIGPLGADRHVLVVAHYDSTSAGPGAADAGIGVATMLEIAGLIRGQQLAHPVTFLFNEGEEAGLIGARAFMENHPLAARVDSVVNLEARGVEGPAVMFETSRPNARAISAFAPAAARPVANSLMTDFYKLLPNSTDVAVFEERPYTILNFAIGGNETRYHSPGDNLAALDRRSLQHMGRQALASVQRLAAGVPEADGQRAFMDIAGR